MTALQAQHGTWQWFLGTPAQAAPCTVTVDLVESNTSYLVLSYAYPLLSSESASAATAKVVAGLYTFGFHLIQLPLESVVH